MKSVILFLSGNLDLLCSACLFLFFVRVHRVGRFGWPRRRRPHTIFFPSSSSLSSSSLSESSKFIFGGYLGKLSNINNPSSSASPSPSSSSSSSGIPAGTAIDPMLVNAGFLRSPLISTARFSPPIHSEHKASRHGLQARDGSHRCAARPQQRAPSQLLAVFWSDRLALHPFLKSMRFAGQNLRGRPFLLVVGRA
eukprot:GABV01000826.1.p2 GENE.GABV01000826.1~~GABV01000826.1.p2  ORF type:complete len:195 (-),score=39.65 GABV01000826.1:26-610(-)